ncbi:MAG: 7,8-dihydroneopterin aldolase/epimerase/oxygenase [Clostridiales bacterium]|nr:7,8-dihydroneopterin aldolase/epimerase/oxygenase [Clostridiales bacterium]MDK2932553.1 7,8-dihydroneopterin aldolase/epimerase/oxygenase [Clostridiales bacterium]
MDKIIIEELEVYAYHGVAPEEKTMGQMFIVSVEIATDLEAAACWDDLSCSINYDDVCADIEQVLTIRKYDLIEAAAMALIDWILNHYPAAISVKVLLKKPWAPLGRHLKYVAIEMERRREEKYGHS